MYNALTAVRPISAHSRASAQRASSPDSTVWSLLLCQIKKPTRTTPVHRIVETCIWSLCK